VPLVSVVCSCKKTFTPEGVLAHLADRTSGCEFTYELAASILEQQQDRADPISTTTLTAKCSRSESLKRRIPYEEELAKLWAAFRGTMYHGQLEWHAQEGSIAEARYHYDIPGLGPFSGSPDLLDPGAGVLYDYKTNKENPRWQYPWPDHVSQVNINRSLVDTAEKVEYQGEVFNLSEPANRMRFVPQRWRSLVLVYMDDKGPKVLTCTRSESKKYKNGNTGKVRVPDLWPDEKVEALVRDRYAEYKESLKDDGPVPPVPEAFEHWMHPLCAYCPVKRQCVTLYLQENTTGSPANEEQTTGTQAAAPSRQPHLASTHS